MDSNKVYKITMIYILGTTHEIMNHEEDASAMNEYYCFLKKEILGKKITIVAEESSVESALDRSMNHDKKTELEAIASELSSVKKPIKYISVDPDRTECARLGIKRRENVMSELRLNLSDFSHAEEWEVNARMANYDCMRERVWLDKLKPFIEKDVIFVCGYMHCGSFAHLLTESGYESVFLRIIV